MKSVYKKLNRKAYLLNKKPKPYISYSKNIFPEIILSEITKQSFSTLNKIAVSNH